VDSTKRSDKQNLRRDHAAEYLQHRYGLRCSAATLKKYATRGYGPRFHRVNRTVLYPIYELDRWAVQRLGPLQAGAVDRAPGDFETATSAPAPALN
jgi:hypothetical protein